MDTIRLTAADFLEKLEAAVAERSAERMTAMQYAEKLIADKEQKITIFDDEQRNLIVNFAFKLDDQAATEELVNGLAAALAEDDKEEVNRLMYDAQEKIENLPDVVENLQAAPLKIERFGNLDDAMSQYQALPNHCMKALGVEKNPDPLPGSLDILQCKNGIDTIVED